MKLSNSFSLVTLGIALSFASTTQAAALQIDSSSSPADLKAAQDIIDQKKEQDGDNQKALYNQHFGAGVMFNYDIGGRERVDDASIEGGVVRVNSSGRTQLGFMLEAHKFLWGVQPGSTVARGPFIGLSMGGGDEIINTGVIGFMFGFRQPNTTNSLNVGVGFSVTPHAQFLGDGVEEGQPLPNGETNVRYKTSTKYGVGVVTSFGF